MDINIVNSLHMNAWRSFVDQHPQGNIFHTPEMFQVFMRSHGYSPRICSAVCENDRILALLLPTQVAVLSGSLRRLTTRAICYGGLLAAGGVEGGQALEVLLKSYCDNACHELLFTELRNLSDQSPMQPVLSRCGFIYEDHLNYLIDISGSPEDVMQKIGSRTRQHIRRGLRKGKVIVEQISDRESLHEWYDLVRKTYRIARVPLADRSLFESAFEILHPRNMVVFWLARIGSTPVAASAELLYKDVVYGWYGGVDREYADEVPGELLMWYILEWGSTNGYHTYDFGGAGKPGEKYGVRDFKAKFGGQLVSFGRNTKVHSPLLLRLSKWGYALYRRFIPNFNN